MADEISVMVTVRPADGRISVRMLVDTPVGLALYDNDVYLDIGQVKEAEWTQPGARGMQVKKKGWMWWYDEQGYGFKTGRTMTKKAAVAAVLAAGNYVEAASNATNQGLF